MTNTAYNTKRKVSRAHHIARVSGGGCADCANMVRHTHSPDGDNEQTDAGGYIASGMGTSGDAGN